MVTEAEVLSTIHNSDTNRPNVSVNGSVNFSPYLSL